jgi:hypothetical protein
VLRGLLERLGLLRQRESEASHHDPVTAIRTRKNTKASETIGSCVAVQPSRARTLAADSSRMPPVWSYAVVRSTTVRRCGFKAGPQSTKDRAALAIKDRSLVAHKNGRTTGLGRDLS